VALLTIRDVRCLPVLGYDALQIQFAHLLEECLVPQVRAPLLDATLGHRHQREQHSQYVGKLPAFLRSESMS